MDKLFKFRTNISAFRRYLSTPPSNQNGSNISPQYRPSELQKLILVWTKKYKSKQDIPQLVAPDLIHRAQSEARIKISNILIVLTILASVAAVLSGKAAAKRGESVQQMNIDWHKKYNEDYENKQASSK
ncbi:UPF0389 protein GA21628 [Danaus plexippus]|uniref:UPF0389 protein GA21628 n=1 Tax=Danaus plexippus TaxID=13037 RepID=UPI002AB121CC|nr:UPF0389 protein GA21628 [Danaus plexippus]